MLHRNEASGALSGLTRVRRFQQVYFVSLFTLTIYHCFRSMLHICYYYNDCILFFRMMHTYSVQRIRFVVFSCPAMLEPFFLPFFWLMLLSVCTLQVTEEVKAVLEFIDYAYKVFGFTYELKLSTVPYLKIVHQCIYQIL